MTDDGPLGSVRSFALAGKQGLGGARRMIVRLDIRRDHEAGPSIDRETNESAIVAGFISVGLPYVDADEPRSLMVVHAAHGP